MPGIDDVMRGGLPAFLGFLLWTVAVHTTARALFDGFVGIEVRRRYEAWFRRRTGPAHRAAWELRNGRQWSPEAARGDTMAATPKLTDAERAARVALIHADQRRTLGFRAVAYALECAICHRFWVATLWWFLLGPAAASISTAVAAWFANALCYAGLATLAAGRIQAPSQSGRPTNSDHSPCGR